MLGAMSRLLGRAEDAGEHLSETVEHAVREHLTGGKIVSVTSLKGEDFDGDEVITVTVIVNAVPSDFEPQKLASLVSKLRSTLANIDEFAFPMVSFMSPAEHEARVQ